MIKVTNKDQAQQVPFNLDGRIFYQSKQIETILLTMQAGEEMDMHKNPFDVLFFVISGNGLLTTPEKVYEVEKNQSIFVTQDELRGWKNVSSNPLEVLVIKILG